MNTQNIPVTKATVRIKTDETTIKENFLIYDSYSCSYDDSVLNEMVDCTKAKYKGQMQDADISITLKMQWVK